MNHPIKDQKVFVKLGAVTALQKRYHRAQRAFDLASQSWDGGKTTNPAVKAQFFAAKARMEAFEEAIAVMELPIS